MIKELTYDVAPESELGKVVESMLTALEEDIKGDDPEKVESLLKAKIISLFDVIREEEQLTQCFIADKLIEKTRG